MNSMDYAVIIENLTKSYGELKAVDDISFHVEKGSLFAFLGINGAGKSTTINIICSILKKDGGKVYVNGFDLDTQSAEIRNEIGIVFQTSVLDMGLTVKQNLDIRASFYSLSKEEKKKTVDSIVELLELQPILNRPVKNLSGGQMRRVDIARAMVHRPKLLILDEPTTGLDPKTRLNVWSLIDKIRMETGMTVFLTTHYLEEAEKATDVVIMDKGNIIAQGSPNELKNLYSRDNVICYRPRDGKLEESLEKDGVRYGYDEEHNCYKIAIRDSSEAKKIIARYDKYLNDIEIIKGTMDDVFLNVTGQKNTQSGGKNDEE